LDRTGADVFERVDVGSPIRIDNVEGPDVRVHRGHPGGWSQKRFKQTAENAWENNAREVVEWTIATNPEIELFLVAGDTRAVGFFLEHLPQHIERIVIDGSRHADHDAFLDAADVALRNRAAEDVVEQLDRWRAAAGEGSGLTGRAAVLTALLQARVETLLVIDDTDESERHTVAFDFESNQVGESERSVRAPVTDGAVALAAATGAEVVVVPTVPDLEGGVGAVLRF
jgi:peptide subunit release factor 1 (eRF1)